MKKLFCIFVTLLCFTTIQAQPNQQIESALQFNWATDSYENNPITITTTDTTLIIENVVTGAFEKYTGFWYNNQKGIFLYPEGKFYFHCHRINKMDNKANRIFSYTRVQNVCNREIVKTY